MSCNGCRVLRKGCSQSCLLRACLEGIDTAEAQGYATVFVAKFFGRAGLMSFISNVPPCQRPALFKSLLFEACGRTINPVTGAAGLLWTGNWHHCQSAVQTILNGGTLRPLPEFLVDASLYSSPKFVVPTVVESHCKPNFADTSMKLSCDLGLNLMPGLVSGGGEKRRRRKSTPSMDSDESVMTTGRESVGDYLVVGDGEEVSPKLLKLFV